MSSLCRYAQRAVCAALILCSWSLAAMAQAPAAAAVPKIDSGDTAWMLTSTALVLMMTIPGLALFYGRMVRKMNVPCYVMQSFAVTCLVHRAVERSEALGNAGIGLHPRRGRSAADIGA